MHEQAFAPKEIVTEIKHAILYAHTLRYVHITQTHVDCIGPMPMLSTC
jgi:hypothetical protein